MKGLGYLADAPVAWLSENLEQADVIYIEVGVSAADQNAGLEFEMAKESGYALVKGDGLVIVDLARVGGASFHCGHHSLSMARRRRLEYITIFVYYDYRNIRGA